MDKTLVVLFAAASLFLGGCDRKAGSGAKSEPGQNPLNAPADYGAALGKAQKSAGKTAGVSALDQAIKQYFAEESEYPKSLDALKAKGITIPEPPPGMRWDYDPSSGTVKAVPK